MDTAILRKAGLTESQAKGYLALVEHGALSPADLADHIGETRTNGYAIADKLVTLGLATKKDDSKRAVYSATHPSNVELLAEKRRKVIERDEKAVKDNMQNLVNYFYEYRSTPGVEVHYGGEGVEKIREKTLTTGKELLFVRSPADATYDQEKLKSFIRHRVAKHITAQSIAPAPQTSTSSREQLDEWLLDRTLVPEGVYDAPVEIDIFGDTVAFIDFENDGMSTAITSRNIADAMRQIFLLAKQVARERFDQTELLQEVSAKSRR